MISFITDDGYTVFYNEKARLGSGRTKRVHPGVAQKSNSSTIANVAVAIISTESKDDESRESSFRRELNVYRLIRSNPPDRPECFLKCYIVFERMIVFEQCPISLETLYYYCLHHPRQDESYSSSELHKIILTLFEGVEYFHHRLKMVHRDIRPANVLLGENCAKLIDFENAVSLTENDATYVYGTIPWCAPEILQHMYDGAERTSIGFNYAECDVYSTALTVWPLLWNREMPSFFEASKAIDAEVPFLSHKGKSAIKEQRRLRLRYRFDATTELDHLVADMLLRAGDRPSSKAVVSRYRKIGPTEMQRLPLVKKIIF